MKQLTTPRIEEMVDKKVKQISAYIFSRSISLQDSAKYERQVWIEALTEAHQAGIDETATELKAVFAKFLDEIPEAYGWGEEDEKADFGYRKCSRNVKAMGLKLLQALQDNK